MIPVGLLRRRLGAEFCPSCERFIGPAEVCPYCDADSARNPLLGTLRRGALLLAVVGLTFLFLSARPDVIPLIKISGITPMMNFAVVRVKGAVEKDAHVGRTKGRVDAVSFALNDGSGSIRVAAYGVTASNLVERKKGLLRDVVVDVTGILNVQADGNTRLVMRSAEEMRLGDPESLNRGAK